MGGGFWYSVLWFAFKLVSLNHWEQLCGKYKQTANVVICFQISIFEPLGTINSSWLLRPILLWFAFKLVSLNHWEQSEQTHPRRPSVVICFQISIFEPLGTILDLNTSQAPWLWFAFKLVSLNHWEQYIEKRGDRNRVVICFQISIFEPLGTMNGGSADLYLSCDLLSN